jgi:glycosyltransferase involved in cell wall biosynthesis
LRIVVNDYLGHAPQVQLSRALASRRHDVLHLYSSGVQTPKADLHRQPDDPPNLTIEGIAPTSRASGSFLGERLRETRFGRAVAKRAMAFRPDVTIGCNNPLDVQRELQRACHRRGIPFVYWMQDFYAVQLDRQLESRSVPLSVAAGGYYHWLERSLLQRSSAVVAVAHDYLNILAEHWDVHDRQCMVVRNWAPLDAVRPRARANSWAKAHGLMDKKVVLYTGTLGPAEDPMQLPALAQRLGAQPDIKLVVVSEGEGAARVAAEARSKGIGNLVVLPFQNHEAYDEVLASADVLLGLISPQAGILYVPSKVSSYLCAGRPIVLSAPWQNVAAQFVRESGGGHVAPADDPAALTEIILGYLNNETLRTQAGEKARQYAEQTFDIVKITDRFERLFERLHTGPPRRRQEGGVQRDAKAPA